MENKEYNNKDIEQLLRPRCEMRASDNLKKSVMNAAAEFAAVPAVAFKPRGRGFRLMPWLAAACAAASVAGFLFFPGINADRKTADGESVPLIAEDMTVTAPLIAEDDAETAPEDPAQLNRKKPTGRRVKVATTLPAKEPESTQPELIAESQQPELIAESQQESTTETESEMETPELMPERSRYLMLAQTLVVSEDDIPVINEKNYILTPEEYDRAERLEHLAALTLALDELKEARLMIKAYKN